MSAAVAHITLPMIQTRGLRKTYAGFVAVDGVSLTVKTGAIHALIGPNGAGKSTLFNLLTRSVAADAGVILFKGDDITHAKASQVAKKGMVRSFQISAVFPHMSARRNIRLALMSRLGVAHRFWMPVGRLGHLDARIDELLATVGLLEAGDREAGALPYGQRRALELATTLAMEPQVLLLDEPTQGMGTEDVERVTELIRRVSRDRTTLMVEHNMGVVARIATEISVMQRGAIIAQGSYQDVSRDATVIEAYMGRRGQQVAHG